VKEEDDMLSNKIRRGVTGGLLIAAATFPSAAHAMLPPPDPTTTTSGQDSIALPVESNGQTGQHGFQWGDAGIGAAGATVLLGAGGLGVAMARRRRVQRAVVG
jgi:hypothetical protein